MPKHRLRERVSQVCLALLTIGFSLAVAAPQDVAAIPAPQSCSIVSEPERIKAVAIDEFGSITDESGRTFRQADIGFAAGFTRPSVGSGDLLFYPLSPKLDRWARRLGHLVDARTGDWLAAGWVFDGQAFVMPAKASWACLAPLLAIEAEARRNRKGFWAKERVFAAGDPGLANRAGRFTFIEGVVRSIGRTRRTHFLNFGGKWSRDFTATIDAREESAFHAAGIDIAALEGRRIRLRGVITLDRGPALAVDHPSQLERLTVSAQAQGRWKGR